ncbi:MAG: ABC transporter transmembrane domain-containing protein, partial [Bosea sp. (in: a-proteobacteria)]
MSAMFRYIWRNSRGEQLRILAIVLVSFPFYYLSLDLPKYIVSDVLQGRAFGEGRTTAPFLRFDLRLPAWLGSGGLRFEGVPLDAMGWLFALSGLFLLLVLINGGFKYVINMRKGALGERLLQRLRFDLFSSLLRLTPEAARRLKPSEAASIIKDEVEPIGGFVGDAFVQPAFLGGQALTALAFILVQNRSLGLIAAATVLAQAIVIPRLRREQLRLSRERQLASRALAGKIGEVVESLGEIANHGTHGVERSQVGRRLEALFAIRYRLFGRKFAVKLLNNLMAQAAPFLFYAVGGYYALTGRLDLGQLVAVIAAYRDLPPPIKELIDWDQQRLDAEAKFQQVTEQFAFSQHADVSSPAVPPASAWTAPRAGAIQFSGLSVLGPAGDRLVDRLSLSLPIGQSALMTDKGGEAAATLAQVLGGRITAYSGSVTLAGQALAELDAATRRRAIAYVGPDATVLDASLRDNIVYSLRRARDAADSDDPLDLSLAGCADLRQLERRIVATLATVGLDDLVFRLGLARRLSAQAAGAIAHEIPALRARIRDRLADASVADAIEPYDPARYLRNGTIADNLLFGWPRDAGLAGAGLATERFAVAVLDRAGLAAPLLETGRRIAMTMLEIFEGLPPDHMLFDQFAFFSAAEFPAYGEMLGRLAQGRANEIDRARLTGLALLYCEPRHRLGLLDARLEAQILLARDSLRSEAPEALRQRVAFFDPQAYCEAAPLRDNLLFGAIAPGATVAQERIVGALREALNALDLALPVFSLGLDQPAGYAGRALFPSARAALTLARSLIRRPQILILNDALGAFGEVEAAAILTRVQAEMAGLTLIVTGRSLGRKTGFDREFVFEGASVTAVTAAAPQDRAPEPAAPPAGPAAEESEDLAALRAVALFAGIDAPRLRLLAFTSLRVNFRAGETLFREGEDSDAAYVLICGCADVMIATARGLVAIS